MRVGVCGDGGCGREGGRRREEPRQEMMGEAAGGVCNFLDIGTTRAEVRGERTTMDGRYKIHRQSLPQGQLPILLKNFGRKSRIEETSETAYQRRLMVHFQVFLAVWLGHVLGGGSMWWEGGRLRWCFDYLILAVSR